MQRLFEFQTGAMVACPGHSTFDAQGAADFEHDPGADLQIKAAFKTDTGRRHVANDGPISLTSDKNLGRPSKRRALELAAFGPGRHDDLSAGTNERIFGFRGAIQQGQQG